MPTKSPQRYKTRRRKSIHSSAGLIQSPIDVRSKSDLSGLIKRIASGPITIVMVYADWCGHCHTMKPIFDEASKSPQRSCQSVAINETMLEEVNNVINKNINTNAKKIKVDGYPSIMAIDNNGNKISDINAVKDKQVMIKVMNESGNIALQRNQPTVNELDYVDPGSDIPLEIVSPPKVVPDIQQAQHLEQEQVTGTIGGSLYSAMAQSAYNLAPTGVLLAAAAVIMGNKRNKSKKSKKLNKLNKLNKRNQSKKQRKQRN